MRAAYLAFTEYFSYHSNLTLYWDYAEFATKKGPLVNRFLDDFWIRDRLRYLFLSEDEMLCGYKEHVVWSGHVMFVRVLLMNDLFLI